VMFTFSFCQMNPAYIALHGVSNHNLSEGSVLIANDKKGNTIQAGIFGGTFMSNYVLGDKTIIGNSFLNGYISKLNSQNEIEWALKIGGNNQLEFRFIDVDSKGNIFICGSFRGTVDFNPDPSIIKNVAGSSTNITNFILKLDPNGVFLWVSTFGGRSWDTVGEAFKIDRSDNIIVAGTFTNTFYYGSFTMNTTGPLLYCIKVNNIDGKLIWGKKYILTYNDFNMDISIDESNNIFILSQFTNNLTFELTPPYRFVTAEGKTDIYIVKLSSTGEYLKFKNFKLAGEQQAKVIMHDDEENIIILYKSIMSEASSQYVHLIEKYSKDIGSLLWSKSLANSNLTDVVLNKHYDIVCTGDFGGTTMFDPSTSKYKIIGNGKAFVSKISKDGTFLGENILNTTGIIKPYQIEFSPPNQITVAGFILNKAYLNPIDTFLFISDENKIENFTFRWDDQCPSVTYKNETKHECAPFSHMDSLISSSGLYTFKSASVSGCLVENRLTATVSNLQATIIASQDSIFTTETKATQYIWTDCETLDLPFISTINTYIPPHNGSYILKVKDNYCKDSSDVCIDFPQISLISKTNDKSFGKNVKLSKNGFGFITSHETEKKGRVDIYKITPDNGWKLIQSISSPLGNSEFFGYEISSHNNLLLVSDVDDLSKSGICHLYRLKNDQFVFLSTISNPENTDNGKFGNKTDIYDNFIVISSPVDSTTFSQNKSGKVYLFEYGANTVRFSQQISSPSLNIEESFGSSIDIFENQIFITAPKTKLGNDYQGLIYVYKIIDNGSSVSLLDSLLNLNEIKDFGKIIGCSNSHLCVVGDSQIVIYKNILDRWLYDNTIDLQSDDVINDIALHHQKLVFSIFSEDARVIIEDLDTGESKNIAINNTNMHLTNYKLSLDMDENFIMVGIPEFDIYGTDNGLVYVHPLNEISDIENTVNSFYDLNIYPNPAIDFINIDGVEFLESQITIFDIMGKILLTSKKSIIDISSLQSGMYLLNIDVKGKYMTTTKFVKS
jgi:Secretion system C-terminal sorting domain